MNAELTVSMDETLIKRAQQYAQAHNMNMSELFSAIVSKLDNEKPVKSDRAYGSLYNAIKDMPKASYTDNPVALQKQMRNELLDKPSIASVVGMFKDTDDGRDYKDILKEARDERLTKYQ